VEWGVCEMLGRVVLTMLRIAHAHGMGMGLSRDACLYGVICASGCITWPSSRPNSAPVS